jgi:CYTH domain-containing protein
MQAPVEIERKFLVADLPAGLESFASAEIHQGYIAVSDGLEVRLRRKGARCTETVKGPGSLCRLEIEVELSESQLETLWPATEGRRVVKRRYRVPYGPHTVELDVYRDRLEGLVTAEVEFDSVEASVAFEPPPWFGRELTEDPRYKNRNLALGGLPKENAP